MHFNEIENSLPNGFHDSDVLEIHTDYINRIVKIIMDISMDTPDDKLEIGTKRAELVVEELEYLIIDLPDDSGNYRYWEPKGLWIDSGDFDSSGPKPKVELPQLRNKSGFRVWFFVNNWNSFIYFAAGKASLIWK